MLERLTERDEYGNTDIVGVESADLQLNLEFDEFNKVTNALNRLASYEDSGLSPEEVQELARAKADGRLVVLPCKVGIRGMIEINEQTTTKVEYPKFDADHLNCRECECPKCDYFHQNNGTCEEGCATCNSKTHVLRCMMFKERAG